MDEKRIIEIEENLKSISPLPWYIEPVATDSAVWMKVFDSQGNELFESESVALNNNFWNGGGRELPTDPKWYLDNKNWIYKEDGELQYNNSKFMASAPQIISELLVEIKKLKGLSLLEK